MIAQLRKLGAKSILVTSCFSNENKTSFVLGYDEKSDETFFLPYTLIPVRFPGTGDVFTSVLTSQIMNGRSLKESCQIAMKLLYDLIDMNKDKEDKFAGLDLEYLLSERRKGVER